MANIPFFLSPGVKVNEFNLTTTIPAVPTIAAGIAGQFRWGPINKRVLVDTENASATSLVNTFFKPNDSAYLAFLTAAQFLSYSGSLWVVRSGNTIYKNATADGSGLYIANRDTYEASYYAGGASVGDYAARYAGALGNSLLVSSCPSANAFSDTLSLTANTTAGSNLVTFSGNVVGTLTPGDLLQVGTLGEALVIKVQSNGSNSNATVNSTAIINATLVANTAKRRWAWSKYFAGAPGTSRFASQVNGANDQIHVIVVDQGGQFTGTANTVLEVFPYLSLASDAKNVDGTSNYYRNVLFQKSKYAYWMQNNSAGTNWGQSASGNTFTQINVPEYASLSGGVEGTSTDGDKETAYSYFLNTDDVTVRFLIGVDADLNIAEYLIENIAEVRKDCVAYISPNFSDVVNNAGNEDTAILAYRNQLPSSSYGFMDSSWKYVYDKYNDVYRWIPLCGDSAGLQAQSAITTAPWAPGAGYERGIIKNAVKLSWNPSQVDRDLLFPACVNPAVTFPGFGPMLFGDTTMLSENSDFNAIGIRFLFIILEQAIASASKFSLFKFNNHATQNAFLNLVNPFLRQVQGLGGINSFLVVCDDTNNTPIVVQSKNFIGDIYIKAAESIRGIQLNFVASPQGVAFTEIVGTF